MQPKLKTDREADSGTKSALAVMTSGQKAQASEILRLRVKIQAGVSPERVTLPLRADSQMTMTQGKI